MLQMREGAGLATSGAPKVAVRVTTGCNGLQTLKWVLDKEVPADGLLYLIHVRPTVRWIPNGLGSKFPVERVHPSVVKRYKNHLSLEGEKLLDLYRRLCDKKKVQSKVLISVSDSVQKELVSQLTSFGITKLVLGISSKSLLSRALKKDSISTYVAENSPAFCTVMVVNKGTLCFVKNAVTDPVERGNSCSSENDSRMLTVQRIVMGTDDIVGGGLREGINVQDGGEYTLSGVLEDISNLQRIPQAGSIGTVSEIVMETPTSITNDSVPLLVSDENLLMDSSPTASQMAVSMAPDVNLLQKQLIEARLCAESAQAEAERQRKKVEEVLTSADKKVMKHEMHVHALKEAEHSMKQCKEAFAAALEVVMKDHEKDKRRLVEEITKHQETQDELALVKERADVYAHEAACAKNHAEAERRRYEETVSKLEDMAKNYDIGFQLPMQAEVMDCQEVSASAGALVTLGRQQQGYSEYSFQELQSATDNFSEENKLGEGRHGPVYKGKVHHTPVAIKVLHQDRPDGHWYFHREVELLSRIRHPHILTLFGACPERGIVYEFMANGSLEDRLNCKDGTPPLPWQTRFRFCLEVATALLFLHMQPKPIVHGHLKLANILLDHHFVCKISNVSLGTILPHKPMFNVADDKVSIPVGISPSSFTPDSQRTGAESFECDLYALGIIMLQLLTGRTDVGLVDLVKEAVRNQKIAKLLDISAGDWPLDDAIKLAHVSLQCIASGSSECPRLEVDVLPVLESIQIVAGMAATDMACTRLASPSRQLIIPSLFFCPIYKDIMEDPCFAADGFTYEHDAIRIWLQTNNTSPMTNMRLDHRNIMPNYALRSVIKECRDRGLI